MRFVVQHVEVFRLPPINAAPYFFVDFECREVPRLAFKLDLQSIDVVSIDMSIAHGMGEDSRGEVAGVRKHMRQQCVTRNVEWHAETHVATPLVENTVQDASRRLAAVLGSGKRNVELCEHVAWWKRHLFQVCGVPCAEYDAAVVRLVLQLVDNLCKLIDALACVVCVMSSVLCAEMPPLETIDGAQVAFLVVREAYRVEEFARAIAVPDLDASFGERLGRGAASDEPQQLAHDGAQEGALCGKKREDEFGRLRGVGGGSRQGELHLWGRKDGVCAGAGAVGAVLAIAEDIADQMEILVLLMRGI